MPLQTNGMTFSILRSAILAKSKTEPCFYMTYDDALLAIGSFLAIEPMREMTPMALMHKLKDNLKNKVAVAFRADGIWCQYTNFKDGPMLVMAKELDEVKKISEDWIDPKERDMAVTAIARMEEVMKVNRS